MVLTPSLLLRVSRPRSVHVRTGEEVAVKIVDLEEACVPVHAHLLRAAGLCTDTARCTLPDCPPSEDEVKEIQQEIAVLSQIRSPYVTRFISACAVQGDVPRSPPLVA